MDQRRFGGTGIRSRSSVSTRDDVSRLHDGYPHDLDRAVCVGER